MSFACGIVSWMQNRMPQVGLTNSEAYLDIKIHRIEAVRITCQVIESS